MLQKLLKFTAQTLFGGFLLWIVPSLVPFIGELIINGLGGITKSEFSRLRSQVQEIPGSDPTVTAKTYETIAEITVRRLESQGLVGIPGPQGEPGPPGPAGMSSVAKLPEEILNQISVLERRVEEIQAEVMALKSDNSTGGGEVITVKALSESGPILDPDTTQKTGDFLVSFKRFREIKGYFRFEYVVQNISDRDSEYCMSHEGVFYSDSGRELTNKKYSELGEKKWIQYAV